MARKEAPPFYVVKDTREQQGYYFGPYQTCAGMVERKLDTGDYTIDGLEDQVCVERKASIEELAINLGQKKYPFLAEIERMKGFTHKFIVLEFELQDLVDFPENSNIPENLRADVKISGKYILKCLMEFQLYHNIHILFCGNKHNAFLVVSSLLKRINEMYTIGRKD